MDNSSNINSTRYKVLEKKNISQSASKYGNFTVLLTKMALTVPNQLLGIYFKFHILF